jgi:WD40 repeat protein
MSEFALDAYVGAALFDRAGQAWFALGDGRVVDGNGASYKAHDGAILCAAAHPSGDGVLTGGEDGRVTWTRANGGETLYARPGRWIDALAAGEASGLWALASGRKVEVRDTADGAFARTFQHDRSAAALAFDAKGRRLAVATYGGVALWYARIADQTPQTLKWAGSHIEVGWSPDGRFVISSMQENALHGWRLADGKDMRMGGYPNKVRSLAFLARGKALATSGAAGAVVWPFAGTDGPMGKAAAELDLVEDSVVTRVAASPSSQTIVIGRSDGSVRAVELESGAGRSLAPVTGSPVSALAMSPDGRRVGFGDEAGFAAVITLSSVALSS